MLILSLFLLPAYTIALECEKEELMKKRLVSIFLCAAMTVVLVAGCSSDDETSAAAGTKEQAEEKETVKVVLNEVAHSIFYAPMYVAVEEGYFAEEGIDLDLVTGFGVHQLVQDTL